MSFQELVVILRVRFVSKLSHFDLMNFDELFRLPLLMMMGFRAPDGEETLFSLVLHPWIL